MTQNGLPFALGRRADGWLAAERGSFEFMLKPGKGTLRVDLGAGRVLTFKKLGKRKAVPAAIAGTYVSADSGATWEIKRNGEDWTAAVGGPLIAGGAPWPVRGIDADTVEIETPGSWITVTQLAHLVRDRAGRIVALEVSTGRIKKMRFERSGSLAGEGRPQPNQRNGIAYIRPPLVHSAFWPRSSLSGVLTPTLRSKLSP